MVFSYFYGSANPSWSLSCHVNSFSTGVLLFKWIQSFSTSARSTLSFLTGVCFIRPKLSLFSRSPTLFFKDSDILIKYPSYGCEGSPFFSRQCSYPVILRKILTELQVNYSSSLFFSGGFNSSFRCWSYSFPYFNVFLIPLHLIIIHLLLFNCSGVLKKSQRFVLTLCFRSSSFKDVISFKPFNSTGAIPPFNQLFNGVSFSGP